MLQPKDCVFQIRQKKVSFYRKNKQGQRRSGVGQWDEQVRDCIVEQETSFFAVSQFSEGDFESGKYCFTFHYLTVSHCLFKHDTGLKFGILGRWKPDTIW